MTGEQKNAEDLDGTYIEIQGGNKFVNHSTSGRKTRVG
jgi:hypothetical protein